MPNGQKVVDNLAHWAYNKYRKRKEETERSETMSKIFNNIKVESMKDIRYYLAEIQMATGYNCEYLGQVFDEMMVDGQTAEDALREIYEISLGRDWDEEPDEELIA